MNKNVINFLATIVLAAVFSIFLPWWSIMTAALVTSLFIPLKKAAVFFVPFSSIFLFWAVYCFVLSNANDFTLARKISQLLQIGGNPYLLILITGIIGGLAAGIAAIFGKQIVAFNDKA
ncbi:hypothetical protein [Flagellimonas meridianipacifica]|uniref:Uncharacterized protein n=1 Tax=Flagellimonas meridianipacifica TaxID=1080225 RepID=A0A2T0MBL2_9FLAO|nr:hypothetical protein [Allomuricauda pacifica]PRX54887.1 hypothetical protein CLV81_3292 [Allomuricauda pacifica]